MIEDFKFFLDSNIWLYVFIESQDVEKSRRCRELVGKLRPQICLSSQVIGEVCVNLIRKANFDETRIRQLISRFYYDHEVVSIEHGILLKASELREQHPFSFWDSVVVSSALAANASILYSEDMQDGLLLERRLKIANPIKNQIV